MADTKINGIPPEVQDELISIGILQRYREGRLKQVQVLNFREQDIARAVEMHQRRAIEMLLGVKIDAGLLADLLKEHNERAARERAGRP
jgi:hypothetical protein